jgi:hypothetical protein
MGFGVPAVRLIAPGGYNPKRSNAFHFVGMSTIWLLNCTVPNAALINKEGSCTGERCLISSWVVITAI